MGSFDRGIKFRYGQDEPPRYYKTVPETIHHIYRISHRRFSGVYFAIHLISKHLSSHHYVQGSGVCYHMDTHVVMSWLLFSLNL